METLIDSGWYCRSCNPLGITGSSFGDNRRLIEIRFPIEYIAYDEEEENGKQTV